MEIVLDGKRVRLDPSAMVGAGGEAEVFDLGDGRAVKVFKNARHPDIRGDPAAEQAAQEKIAEHQRKLPAFPRGLPTRVVAPLTLARDRAGKEIVGYAMPLIPGADMLRRYAEPKFHATGSARDAVIAALRDLHGTVTGLHAARVIIADFNDCNVLVRGSDAHIIDADSFQYGQFQTRMFTARFVDPLKCAARASSLMLARPHDTDSDWYAFAVMLFQSLCCVDPYGGVYRPKDSGKRIPHDERPLRRITVFNPEVVYPKPAVPFGLLPDDLLQRFHAVFERDARGAFPAALLDTLRWTSCSRCGAVHARAVCPSCAAAAPAAVRQTVVVRGTVTATRLFRTNGVILHACVDATPTGASGRGVLRWLAYERGTYTREDGTVALRGGYDPSMRIRIQGDATLIAHDDVLATLRPGQSATQRAIGRYRGAQPVFDANSTHTYWVAGDALWRDGGTGLTAGDVRIGSVLPHQTRVWVGEQFGFGWYRAGDMQVAFVCDAERVGITDTVVLPRVRGQLLDAWATFSDDRCWAFMAEAIGGKTVHRCVVITRTGSTEATAEAVAGDGTWLGGAIRGHAAVGHMLLAATDDGIVRVEPDGNGGLTVIKTFPDTEPFVQAGVRLLPIRDGLAVVGEKEVMVLKIK